ncbi:MAG: SCO family protein [Pelagimonas sp.]|jgi:protein SCO1/2|nr:SCO family protein [Pelagimonas sp.]
MSRGIAILASVLLLALMGGIFWVTRGGDADDQFAQCRQGAVAGGAGQIGGPFTLVNKNGETVTDQDVITEPSLLYFGYTFCPDVCPFDTVRNAEAVDILEAQGQSVTPVFVSIDPDRDTPEAVGDFAHNIHDKMVGLTGSHEQVSAASKAYRTYYKKQDGDPDYYLVDHSTFTYLVLPEHGFVDYFRREVTPKDMAKRVSCFIDAM